MPAPTALNPDWFTLGMGLLGGLALFLFGLDQVSSGLKRAAGDTLKTLLTRLTANRFLGACTGAAVTGVLNSSSVTTVLVVGFVTAGVMSLTQSVAVIMGANIGSTVTAQILAFNLSAYSLLPVAAGFFMLFAGKRDAIRDWGTILMGLGLVFYGMGIMSDAMKPLRSYPPFVQALASMERPLYGILAGAVFTGLVQSSAATVGLAIAMASEGLLSLPGGIALALGANIGTCATALLAALGKPVEAVRTAVVHVLFNLLGVVLWLPFIGVLSRFAVAVSPVGSGLEGVERLAVEVPRQIANANTLFNVLNTAVFIGFTGWFARFTTWLVPDRKAERAAAAPPSILDPSAALVPAIALEQVRQELGRLGEVVGDMLSEFPPRTGMLEPAAAARLSSRGQEVETIQGAVLDFLGLTRRETSTREQMETQVALTTIALHFREIADVIAEDLPSLGWTAASGGHPPGSAWSGFGDLCQAVQESVGAATKAVRGQDAAAVAAVAAMSGPVRQLADDLMSRLAAGLGVDGPGDLAALRLQTTRVNALRQIFTLTKRIARAAGPP